MCVWIHRALMRLGRHLVMEAKLCRGEVADEDTPPYIDGFKPRVTARWQRPNTHAHSHTHTHSEVV